MNQPEPLMTVHLLPDELPAVDAAVVSYLSLIEATVPATALRADVINKLHSFQQRYQALLNTTRDPAEPVAEPACLIPFHVTIYELMAFGTAVIGYLRLFEMTVSPAEFKEVSEHLCRFQQRYVDALPPSPSLHKY